MIEPPVVIMAITLGIVGSAFMASADPPDAVMVPMLKADLGDDEACVLPPGAELPDLRTMVPQQIGIHNAKQRQVLRFTNTIANVGKAALWVEPPLLIDDPDIDENPPAFQVFSDGSTIIPQDAVPPASSVEGYLGRCALGEFDYHPEHNHWHIAEVADYRVCHESGFSPDSPETCEAIGDPAEKVTFCLIDWTKLGEKSAASDETRSFWDCYTSFQGISPGWGDQYHHSLPDQGIDITGADPGTYYLVSTANPHGIFMEESLDNNSSWVKFRLEHEGNGNGNLKLTILGNSCDDSELMESLEADVEQYIESSETDVLSEDFVHDLCNGVNANR
jgi:hypothetical protein